MAILIDLGEEFEDINSHDQAPNLQPTHSTKPDYYSTYHNHNTDAPNSPRPPPNLTSLAVPYPVISSLASNLDHNDLSSLANTCKLMRETMLQYRKGLLRASLVCCWSSTKEKEQAALQTTRRVLCVRDLVNICRTCRKPACRNCAEIPGSPCNQTTGRLTIEQRKQLACHVRRICRQCQTSPEVLSPHPGSSISHKICTCPAWQCRICATSCPPPTFQALLYYEKLQLIEHPYGTCTHFQPAFCPPNSERVWVEECPSPTHKSLHSGTTHGTAEPITCGMELFSGGWAHQDYTTGYIYRPPPESCIGTTAQWWAHLASDPNEGGFITFSTNPLIDFLQPAESCVSHKLAYLAWIAGRGQDPGGIGRAIERFDQVSLVFEIAINAELILAEVHRILAAERAGIVRAWCTSCEGIVLARGENVGLE